MQHSVCLACNSSNKQLHHVLPARPLDSPLCHPNTSVCLYVAFLSTSSTVLVTSDISGDSARCPAALTRSLQRPNSRLKTLYLVMPVSLSTDTPATRTVLLWVCWLPPVGAKFFLFVRHLTIRRCTVASLNASQKSVTCHYRPVTGASQIFVYILNNV